MTSTWELVLTWLTLLYTELIEQENNIDDFFTGDVRTFMISYSQSILDKSFSGVSTILIKNELWRWVTWKEEVFFFRLSYYLS